MEQNLSSFSAAATAKPAKEKMSRTKLVLIIIGGVIALLVIGNIILNIRYYVAVVTPIHDAAEAEYTKSDSERGGQNYVKMTEINGIPARLSLRVPSGSSYDVIMVLRPQEPYNIDGSDYDIAIDFSTSKFPWDDKIFFGWSYGSSEHSSTAMGVEISKDGTPFGSDYDRLSPDDRLMLAKMKEYYMPMLEYVKAEYERLIEQYK